MAIHAINITTYSYITKLMASMLVTSLDTSFLEISLDLSIARFIAVSLPLIDELAKWIKQRE